MSERRRRRLDDEGEDESADTTTSTTESNVVRPRVKSECESEGESGDVELSEYDSESAAEGGEREETEEGSESETEEGSETEETSDTGTETGGEDYTDEEDLNGERQSGDGEEQPETDKPDDDEDRKNPAYVPRKGAFYEHDFRDGIEGEEEGEEEVNEQIKPKKKLWQEEDKWSHDHYRDDLQAPKTREELIAIYGYDIRAADKPPEISPRKPRQNTGPRREQRFRDFLPRMAVIDTTEYGKDTVPNIDKDGLITYEDSVPRNNSRPYNNRRGRGRGGRNQRNNKEEDLGDEWNNKQYQRRDDKSYPQSYGSGRLTEDYPSLQEVSQSRSEQEESSRVRKVIQTDNRYRESNQQNNRHRDSNQQDNRYNRDSNQDSRYNRDSNQDSRYNRDSNQDSRYNRNSNQDSRYSRDSNQDSRYNRDSNQDSRYNRESNQDSRYNRDSNQYDNEDRTNNYGYRDNRRGGYRGGNRGQGSSNYRQDQNVRQPESRMNDDNWNPRDRYDSNRKDRRYNNNRGEENRRVIMHEDQSSPRLQALRDDGNKNYKSQDRGYNNKRAPYQGGDNNAPRRSGNDEYSTSKRGGYRSYEQPPRYQQQQQQLQQSSRETREYTNTSYKADDVAGGRNVQDSEANSYSPGIGTGDAVDPNAGKNSQAAVSNVEKKSYAKERRAKGTQCVGDPGVKERPANMSGSVDSPVTGQPQQYIKPTPGASTEATSAPAAAGSKRYSSQRQQGLSKGGNYTEPLPAERGANLYNPALPPPSFYQRDPANGGQQPNSSSPAVVSDAPHFNPAILPPGTTALPYHLPAVPQPGLQMAGTSRPPTVFRPAQGLPPPPPPPAAAAAIARPGPPLIAPPYIPPGMIYRAPAAPPRVPPPGTPAGLSLPFAYTSPPPPNPLTGTAPTAVVSQADQMALTTAPQGQQPAGQPKKVFRSDIIYYAPELQHPSRTPQKRPKSAIPIVDPEEIRRLKQKGSLDDRSNEKEDSTAKRASPPHHSPVTSASQAEGLLPSHTSDINEGTSEDPRSTASESPKPQRSPHDRPKRERISGEAEIKKEQEVVNGSIKSQTDQKYVNVNLAEELSSKVSVKGEEVPNTEVNHVISSSLPIAVETMKNNVLEVSKDLSVLDKTAVTTYNKPDENTASSSSSATAVTKSSGDQVKASSTAGHDITGTDVVVKTEAAA